MIRFHNILKYLTLNLNYRKYLIEILEDSVEVGNYDQFSCTAFIFVVRQTISKLMSFTSQTSDIPSRPRAKLRYEIFDTFHHDCKLY